MYFFRISYVWWCFVLPFPDGQLYVGTIADFAGLEPLIYREPLRTEQYDLSTLNCKLRDNLSFPLFLSRIWMVYLYVNNGVFILLWELKELVFAAPNFVSSFALGDFVYFFFREIAVEYLNCGKVSQPDVEYLTRGKAR